MKCVLGLVFLLCTLGTSLGKMDLIANADKVNDLKAEFLLFDFMARDSKDAVLSAFEPVADRIVFQTKFYGISRYSFVLYNDNSQALKDFSLSLDFLSPPSVSSVQTIYSYFKHFDKNTRYEPTNFSKPMNGELTYVEGTFSLEGLTFEQMVALLSAFADSVKNLPFNYQTFFEGSGLPFKFHIFWTTMNDNDIETWMMAHNSLFGGPGHVLTTMNKIAFI